MARFRNIDYGKMLYETLRNYFSVNANGQISILYKYLAAIIQPLVLPFNNYAAQRSVNGLVASCAWQIGQLTNVLNYLFDSTLNRIYITQGMFLQILVPEFTGDGNSKVFVKEFGSGVSGVMVKEFQEELSYQATTIHVPVSVNLSALIAIVEQIRLQGIIYVISTF